MNENRGIINSLCKVYYENSEDQKDAFQDIILQLWISFDSYRGESKISTWIYRVSLNTILTKKRRDEKSISKEPFHPLHQNLAQAKADDNVELLFIIIQSLKDIDKAIIVLYLEGYKNKEIAEILKMSSTNVATRFNRLKSQLKLKFNTEPYASKQS